jgi:hypothetical protein
MVESSRTLSNRLLHPTVILLPLILGRVKRDDTRCIARQVILVHEHGVYTSREQQSWMLLMIKNEPIISA